MTGTMVVGRAAPTRSGPEAGLGLIGWWLLVPITAVLLLVWIGDHGGESIRFLITWLLTVLWPGTLLWRALAGGRSVTQDLGFGAVLGLVWQLANWAICTAIGKPLLPWASLALLVLTFAVVPALRPRLGWRGTSPVPPRWWHLLLVTSLVLAVFRTVVVLLRSLPLPPEAAARHQDLWYQLGLVQVLTRDVTPGDPSALGEPLIYHWFATASMASHSVMSDVDPPQVLMHQWPITMVLTLVLVGWAAGEALSERAWVGPLAGAVAGVLPGALQLTDTPRVNLLAAQSVQGPTGTMAAVVMLALVGPTVLILRRQAGRGAWVAMILLLALATGTKPTLLPIMLVGCVLAGLFTWYSERRPPWRLVTLAAVVAAFLVASTFALTGSTGGSRIQFLGLLRLQPYYQAVTGDKSFPAGGGWVLPSLESGDSRMVLFAAILVTWYLVTGAPRLLCLLGLTTPPVRRDPAYWWLGGCVVAGTCVPMVFSHTGYSEYHFLSAILGLGLVGAVAVAANLVTGASWRAFVVVAPAGFVTAALLYLLWPTDTGTRTVAGAFVGLLVPFAVLAAVGTIVILLVNRTRARAAIGLQVIILAIAASLPVQLAVIAQATEDALQQQRAPDVQNRTYLTRDEQEAMLWLHREAADDDVAISNVFCHPTPYRQLCPNDAFWVSGLSGVQLYLGGWAYTPPNLAATRNRTSFLRQPPPWPDRLQESLDAIRKPNPALLQRLSHTIGVDWIIADRRAGPVSPDLDRLADLAYSNQDVRIYRLR